MSRHSGDIRCPSVHHASFVTTYSFDFADKVEKFRDNEPKERRKISEVLLENLLSEDVYRKPREKRYSADIRLKRIRADYLKKQNPDRVRPSVNSFENKPRSPCAETINSPYADQNSKAHPPHTNVTDDTEKEQYFCDKSTSQVINQLIPCDTKESCDGKSCHVFVTAVLFLTD